MLEINDRQYLLLAFSQCGTQTSLHFVTLCLTLHCSAAGYTEELAP